MTTTKGKTCLAQKEEIAQQGGEREEEWELVITVGRDHELGFPDSRGTPACQASVQEIDGGTSAFSKV